MRTDEPTDGRTDGHEEANSRFSQFYESAYKLNDIGRAVQNKNGRSSFERWDTEHAEGLYCDMLMAVTVIRVQSSKFIVQHRISSQIWNY